MQTLNPWYSVCYRNVNQRIRRVIYSFDSPLRRRLWEERRYIAAYDTLTTEQRIRLGEINWKLGHGGVYRLSEEERQRQIQVTREVLRERTEEELAP